VTVLAPVATRAHEIAQELLRLGERERAVILEGRLDQLAAIADTRSVLTRDLEAALVAEPLRPGELRELLLGLHEQARETMALLSSGRGEITGQVDEEREDRHAATSDETGRTL